LPSASEVVCPQSVAELSDCLAAAAREGKRVSIEREGGDVVVSLAGLDRVLEHEAGDLTVTAEAGIRLSALAGRLAKASQMLALDPPGDPTLGACLAANLSGPRRHRYGAPRDLVLGVTLVLADGTVASAGGKVVKNVAGYDLGKLVCGSRGALGVIARVSLRLHPIPAAERSLVAGVAGAQEAERLWQLLHRSTLVPSAVDLLWEGSRGRLAVLFEGSQRAVAAQLAAARELLGGEEAEPSIWEEARAWQTRAAGRISFPPRGLETTLRGLREALVRPGVGSAYTIEPSLADRLEEGAALLAERIRRAFDPESILVT
jgi:glycolate oxidase FAD binding subunit